MTNNNMNPGDILLFKGEGGLSRLIAWGTRSKYTHVAICVSAEMNLAIEAIAGGGLDIVPQGDRTYRGLNEQIRMCER